MPRFLAAALRRAAIPALLSLLLAGSLASCGGDGSPDVSGSKVKVNSRRFDLDFAAIDTLKTGQGLQALAGKYPDFLRFFTDTFLVAGLGDRYSDTAAGVQQLRLFLTSPDYRQLLDTVRAHFPDTRSIDEQLEKGFAYYKHYFPAQFVPAVVYFPSYLAKVPAYLTGAGVLGIPLDMYLGPDYPYYDAPNIDIPRYAQERCRPEFIPVNAFRLLYDNLHPFEQENKSLLEMMLQRGQEQYFLEKVLPFTEAATRFGMTAAQLKWCEENEAAAYNFFVQQNLIYSKDWQKILRYVNDGPNAMGFPPEAPANVGSWIGYRIVRSYAKENPKLELAAVCAPVDAQQLLLGARYKPR